MRLARRGDAAALMRLAERAENEGWETVRRQALMVGLFEVLKREREAQKIRLAGQYLMAKDGDFRISPFGLPIKLYCRWLKKEAISAARRIWRSLRSCGPSAGGPWRRCWRRRPRSSGKSCSPS